MSDQLFYILKGNERQICGFKPCKEGGDRKLRELASQDVYVCAHGIAAVLMTLRSTVRTLKAVSIKAAGGVS